MDLLDKVINKASDIPHKPLSTSVFWVGLIIVLYLLAQITWKLVPTSELASNWHPTPESISKGKHVSVSQLQALSLFGRADEASSKPKIAPVEEQITDAPKTSLSIQLTGVVASTSQQKGLAVIASSGSQDTYGLGDKIKGTSASLKEVYADRIIITNSGRYETLMLDGLDYDTNGFANKQLQQAKSIRKVDRRKNSEFAKEVLASRDELLADPSKLTDYLAISPVQREGTLQGYRLNAGKDRGLFEKAGLKANDLAKSINGYDLTEMTQALEVMAQLPELTEISLMVERDGQLVEIMFSLPN
ncbi:type II secretion system protein GspC [Shewanella sp. D64]|uniref:type II secretion system protein GspC n=1 Tax=unclassified Shewanella TaxID=196818 RepID=UPI0022BA5D3C|nr:MULTISPECIES: type II secretion system protein GspC [unclassified Shewanella]MEC4726200.1 type II secretion system protein GspC [Shewanella sp. D64]MEC4738212.1 type II secretion system protein GspC [Shewanella sp. E94]WBJ95355.1 type II secretion system protein GspC [Shewanella sp. MTB7]